MDMYHAARPDGEYRMVNKVQVLDPPHAIAWLPGYDANGDGHPEFGG